MMAVDTFRIILLNMSPVVKLYPGQTTSRFFKGDNILNALITGFNTGMALPAFNSSAVFFMAVLAEIMENYHL